MKKSAQVVMFPTNEKANIWLDNFGTGLYNCPTGATGVIYQHLYILSDEKIKEGDWFVGFADGSIKPFVKQADESTVEINNWQLNKKGHSSNKKIIATTDSNLTIKTLLFVQGENKEIDVLLPQPSQSFIDKFVEEYNKGNVITEVMVEYEEIQVLKQTLNEGFGSYYHKAESEFVLKVNPTDNTITIRKAKDSWSREEVVELLYKHTEYMLSGKKDTLDKWIEENL